MANSNKIKIGFISSTPLEDKKNWSGTMFKMYEALLQKNYEVIWIEAPVYSIFEEKIMHTITVCYQKLFHRGFNKHHMIARAYFAAKKINLQLKSKNIDVLFAPTSSVETAFLNIKQPIIYLNDANVNQLLNYYSYYSGFGFLSKKITRFIEKKTLKKAATIVYSADWSKKDAISYYHINPEKIVVIKFGANSEVPEKINTHKNLEGEILFLFLAVFWERKGGDIAVETIEILRKKGYPVRLQVVGCNPKVKSEFVNIIPFLNKNNPEEAQKIKDFLNEAHFLFIPTRADCTPISFCEAAGYGLPVITTDTGGISSIVENGVTGITLPLEAKAADFAEKVEALLLDKNLINTMSLQARKKYETELNWEVWGQKMDEVIKKTLLTQ